MVKNKLVGYPNENTPVPEGTEVYSRGGNVKASTGKFDGCSGTFNVYL